MIVHKTYVGQNGQFVTHVQEGQTGMQVQLEGVMHDKATPINMPWAVRLSTDAIYDTVVYYGEQNNKLTMALDQKLIDESSNAWLTNYQRLITKSNTNIEWGIPEVSSDTARDMFDVENNSVTIPMNSDIVDRKYKIINSGLLDENNFCKNIMSQVRTARPITLEYKNDCTVVCVTFMPKGPLGYTHSNYKEQDWQNGAHFMWSDEDDHTIRKKGVEDYLVPVKDCHVVGSSLGNRIPAGVPIKLTSDTITITNEDNIILHIYR